ncbi:MULTISPECIES: M48 family metallopeptidase [Bacteroidaceae]|uniref:Peptidase M48 domain-containing protein n=4 Tax=Bacteroides acidifaciens TaxID=85831 RepID=A0A4S2AMW5_9BACE|nr:MULTISPECIES: M48 family metallopeptidase [Bacteroidaceae]MCR1998299.1 M48 family metallopeptidase [Bacteroides acidifaciens]TGY02526.1 hypothetical protein E5356_10505 [Bacteroides acidifaciens]
MMCFDVEKIKQNINKSIIVYILGCCCFVCVALWSLWFGYYVIRYQDEHEWPLQLAVISIAGGVLLWEMLRAFRFKNMLPTAYKVTTAQEFPVLFDAIAEVTENLKLSPIHKVYICPDATAAVFIQPYLRNLFFEPKRELVIGLGFLTQMDDEEIRAILYHEFGHYVQQEMKSSISVYVIGQFSRSFVAVKEAEKQGVWRMQIRLQLLLFTYFSMWTCNCINKAYARLAKQMEYDADDVAVNYVGVAVLQKALLHAACVRYNYEVVRWGLQQLQAQNIQVDEPYIALSLVGNYSRPMRRLLSEEVVRRVERLGMLNDSSCIGTKSIQQQAFRMFKRKAGVAQLCPARQFAEWLREGFDIYTRQRLLETSVLLEIHLDRKKHKMPYVDGFYKLLLDGKEIGAGNFIKGYTLKRKTSPGKHTLTTYAPSGLISTPLEFEVEKDGTYRIEMDYKLYVKNGYYNVYGEKCVRLDR